MQRVNNKIMIKEIESKFENPEIDILIPRVHSILEESSLYK